MQDKNGKTLKRLAKVSLAAIIKDSYENEDDGRNLALEVEGRDGFKYKLFVRPEDVTLVE